MIEDYKAAVCYFCFLLSQLYIDLFYETDAEPSQVLRLSLDIKEMKEVLLAIKKKLGFCDGLSFMENTKFRGFSMKEGLLFGNTKDLEKFVTPWICNFPDETNNHMYEVGVYLLTLHSELERRSFHAKKDTKEDIL